MLNQVAARLLLVLAAGSGLQSASVLVLRRLYSS